MNNWKRYFAIALLICFAVTLVPVEAHADALTAGMIGAMAYAIASSQGVTFTAFNATGPAMSDYMADQVEDYVNKKGGSIASWFQGEAAITTAGKLLMGQNLFNGITSFLDWLNEKFPMGSEETPLSNGTYNGVPLGPTIKGDTNWSGQGVGCYFGGEYTYPDGRGPFYSNAYFMNGNATVYNTTPGSGFWFTGEYIVAVNNNGYIEVLANRSNGYREISPLGHVVATNNVVIDNKLSWSAPGNAGIPQPLPDNKQWEGDFSRTPGWAEPQDLPDFLSRIPEAIANNDLVVDGEIVDTQTGGPTPPPPSPTPTPSGPTLGLGEKLAILIGEIIGILYDTSGDTAQETIDQVADGIDEITQTVTDAITETQISTSTQTQDAIQEQTQTITDTITQTQTQTQTEIQDATQTITDTITDTQTDIKDAIQDQTQPMIDTMDDIKDKLDDITEVPDDYQPQKHPLPRGVFPFCIPFDLHDLILALSAAPQTPEIHVPFDLNLPLPGGNVLPFHYQFDLDLHDFDGLAAVLRTLEFVAFGVGLLFVTGKVIKW